MRRGTAISLFLVASSCHHSLWDADAARREKRAGKLDVITAANGIQLEEAKIISETYFSAFMSGCGFAEDPVIAEGKWTAVPRAGYAGDRLTKSIEVDATSGAVRFDGCPEFKTIGALRAAVVKGRSADEKPYPPCWMAAWPKHKGAG
jgi:hypothetical protein